MNLTRRSFLRALVIAGVVLQVDPKTLLSIPVEKKIISLPPLSQDSLLLTYDEILKKFYLPAIKEQLTRDSGFWENWPGKEVIAPNSNSIVRLNYGAKPGPFR